MAGVRRAGQEWKLTHRLQVERQAPRHGSPMARAVRARKHLKHCKPLAWDVFVTPSAFPEGVSGKPLKRTSLGLEKKGSWELSTPRGGIGRVGTGGQGCAPAGGGGGSNLDSSQTVLRCVELGSQGL